MDSKFLFLVGVLILILSTCSVDTAPAERGIDRQAVTMSVCPAVQDGKSCAAPSIGFDGQWSE